MKASFDIPLADLSTAGRMADPLIPPDTTMKLGDYRPSPSRTPITQVAAITAATFAFAIAITAVTFSGVTFTDFKTIRSDVDRSTNNIKNLSAIQQQLEQELSGLNSTIYYFISNFNATIEVNTTLIVNEILHMINGSLEQIQQDLMNLTLNVDLAKNYSIAAHNSALESQAASVNATDASITAQTASGVAEQASISAQDASQSAWMYRNETVVYYGLIIQVYQDTLFLRNETLGFSIQAYNYSEESRMYAELSLAYSLSSSAFANHSQVEAQISEYFANISRVYYESTLTEVEQIMFYYNISLELFEHVNASIIINEGLAFNASESAMLAMYYANLTEVYAQEVFNLSSFFPIYLNETSFFASRASEYANNSMVFYMMTALGYNQSVILFEEMQMLFANFNDTIEYIIHSGILNGNLTNSSIALLVEGIMAANESLQYSMQAHEYLVQIQEIWSYIMFNQSQIESYLLEVQQLAAYVEANATLTHGYLLQVMELVLQAEGNATTAYNSSIEAMMYANFSNYYMTLSQQYSDISQFYATQVYNISQLLGLQTNGTLIFNGIRIGGSQIVFVQDKETIIQAISPASDATIFIPDPGSANSSFVLTTGDQLISGSKSFSTAPQITSFTGNGIIISDSTMHLTETYLANGQILIGTTGTYPIPGSITGTTNQVNVFNGNGTIILSLPQSINPAGVPTFSNLKLTGLDDSAARFTFLSDTAVLNATTPDVDGQLLIGCASCSAAEKVVVGTIVSPNSTIGISFTSTSPRSINVDLPQSVDPTASPTFENLETTENVTAIGYVNALTGSDFPGSNIFTGGIQIGAGSTYITQFDFRSGTTTATLNGINSVTTVGVTYFAYNQIITIFVSPVTSTCNGGAITMTLPDIIKSQENNVAQIWASFTVSGTYTLMQATLSKAVVTISVVSSITGGSPTFTNPSSMATCSFRMFSMTYLQSFL